MGTGFIGNAKEMLEIFTGASKTIDNDHAYIHQKKKFSAFYKASILTTATLLISIQTPATGYIHFRGFKLAPSADKISIDIYEGAIINVAGTALTATNRSRSGTPTVSNLIIKHGTTFSANGTLLPGLSEYLPGSTGVGNVRIGAENDASEEVVLAQNTIYRVVITNGSSATNTIGIKMNWYEEQNG